jgi:hypothetical protein
MIGLGWMELIVIGVVLLVVVAVVGAIVALGVAASNRNREDR